MKRGRVQVACYSGRTYAERPTAFLWEGIEQRVRKIEREWLEPGEKHFRLRTEDDRLFELCYYEDGDHWSVIESVLKSEKGRKR
jgi:hypothetical protein